jgi:carbon storage regulator
MEGSIMLVLTRREGEAIRVGNLTIVVVSTANGKVKLGIEAPRSIPVLRTEIVDRQVAKETRKPVKETVL